MKYLCMKLVRYNAYLVSTVDTDALVLKHYIYSAENTPMRLWLFMG